MSPMQQKEILDYFTKVTSELQEIITSTGEEQLNAKPADGAWSIAQIAEHLRKSYAAVDVMNGNVQPTDRAPDEKVAAVRELFLDFNVKMKSPDAIVPPDDLIEKTRLQQGLEKRIAQFKEIILNKDLSPICVDFEIPGYGPFTRMEWMYFNILHTHRHVHQMKEILKN